MGISVCFFILARVSWAVECRLSSNMALATYHIPFLPFFLLILFITTCDAFCNATNIYILTECLSLSINITLILSSFSQKCSCPLSLPVNSERLECFLNVKRRFNFRIIIIHIIISIFCLKHLTFVKVG